MGARIVSRLSLIIIAVIVVACFLPWETGGDFIRFEKPGLAFSFQWIYLAHGRWPVPTVQDHGGLVVLLLSLTLMLAINLRSAEREPMMPAILLMSALLAALSIGHLLDILIRSAQSSGFDAVRPGPGLILACTASLVLLAAVLKGYLARRSG